MSNWWEPFQQFSDTLQGRYCQIKAEQQKSWQQQRDREQFKKECVEEALRRISIEIRNDASPVIRDLMKDLDAAFSK